LRACRWIFSGREHGGFGFGDWRLKAAWGLGHVGDMTEKFSISSGGVIALAVARSRQD